MIDLERKQGEVEKFYKNLESKNKETETLKENMNKQIRKLKNENTILKKRENIYQDTISRYKQNNTISIDRTINNYTINNSLPNVLSANNIINDVNRSRLMISSNNVQLNNKNQNTSFMTYNPTTNNNELNLSNLDKDESFRYSYYLIDNLKNAINKVDFENEYSNLI